VEYPPYRHETNPKRTYLRIFVENEHAPSWLAFIHDRHPAFMCRALLTFKYENGDKVYLPEMLGRWAGTPEPLVPIVINGKLELAVSMIYARDYIDIPSGSKTTLDVALKLDGDEQCYGWNNESYTKRDFRNKDWELDRGVYIVEVRVNTNGREFNQSFKLFNDKEFRLEIVD
jgi:hypothetical protein